MTKLTASAGKLTEAQAELNAPKLDRILVCIDFSPLSLIAVDAALSLFQQTHLEAQKPTLDLVHVVQDASAFDMPEFIPHNPTTGGMRWATTEMELLIRRYQNSVRIVPHLISGPVPQTIISLAQDEKFDLMVVSSHGRSGLGHVLVGSVAEQLVRQAPCPVLLVKPDRDSGGGFSSARKWHHFHRVLVGFDHRVGARMALNVARKVAAQESCSLDLLHVLDPADLRVATSLLQDVENSRIQDAEAAMRFMAESEGLNMARCRFHARVGAPWQVILDVAMQMQSGLIVLGPHEHRQWRLQLLGSTVDKVARLAPCPVLIVK